MDKIRALIIDDERLTRRRIRTMLSEHPDASIVGEYADGLQAVAALHACLPDVVLLDPKAANVDAFSTTLDLESERRPVVILIVDYDRVALRLLEAHEIDYLLKPFDRQRFFEALATARARRDSTAPARWATALRHGLRELTGSRRPTERLAIRRAGRMMLIRAEEVDWIDNLGNYARLHVNGSAHLLRMRLKDLEAKLDPGQFTRVHRSTIVNIDRIAELAPRTHREYTLTLRDGTVLTSSRSYANRIAALVSD